MQATTATIPAGAAWGAQTITATDTLLKTGTAAYNVQQPTIAISPSEGYMGDTVTVTGQGWIPGIRGLVSISITDSGTTTLAVVSTPADDGSFTGAVTIPVTGVVGPRTITIAAADGATVGNTAASKFFTVKSASISVSPLSQAATKTVTVTGLGFTPQTPVSEVTIAGATINTTPDLVVTDALGKFTCTFVVPGLVGVKTISASVLTDTRTTFLTITSAPVSIDVQLVSISSKLTIVWVYDPTETDPQKQWKYYDPTDPVHTLLSLNKGDGFWIKVTEACKLVYGGNSYDLVAGWNNKGWQG
jgi:hypothetical protein